MRNHGFGPWKEFILYEIFLRKSLSLKGVVMSPCGDMGRVECLEQARTHWVLDGLHYIFLKKQCLSFKWVVGVSPFLLRPRG